MTDYAFRSQVMAENVDKYQSSLTKKMFLAYKSENFERLDELSELWWEAVEKYKDKWVEAKKINNANNQRKYRLWNRIYAMLVSGNCVFVTLTFDDPTLSNTTFEKRRRYVREFLKEQSDYYIANIDFGSETEREHYHAIVMCERLDMSRWQYGFTWVNRIPCSGADLDLNRAEDVAKKLSGYVNKLTNHAIKDTTKRNHVIYGRGKLDLLWKSAKARIMDINK